MDGRIERILTTATIAVFGLTAPGAPETLIDLAVQPADISVFGEATNDLLGSSLASGDIDGDGIKDLLVVACNSAPLGGSRRGTLYVLWGKQLGQGGPVDLATNPGGVSRVFGRPGDDFVYCNVASGDFNRDGYDDIIWGQPATSTFATWAGKAYLIFGDPDFPDTLDLYGDPPGVVTVFGVVEDGTLGTSACACDVDGDDYEDVVLTVPWLEYSEVLIIRGRDNFPPTFNAGQSEPGMVRIIDDAPNANMRGIACADIDRDGSGDLVLGALVADRLVLIYGSPSLTATDSVLLADPPVPTKLVLRDHSPGGFGLGLAFGDLDGDGEIDLVAGAYGADPMGCYDCGEVYVLYDADALPDNVELQNTMVPMTRVIGFGSSARYGFQVLGADLAGDSIDDLVLTNYPNNGRSTTTFVLGRKFMPATVLLATENGPITRITEVKQGDRLGYGVTSIDLNSDGTHDLVLGAHYADPPGRDNAGILYGFLGTTLMTAVGGQPSPNFALQNFPNPFSGRTTITFNSVAVGPVELSVYDVTGRRVFRRSVSNHRGGELEFVWNARDEDGRDLPSGVYFCRISTGGVTETRKMVVVR